LCDAVYLRILLSLSHEPTFFHHCLGFVLFLHCVGACWSNRAAVRLVELSAGWLASCSIAAEVHHSRSAWAGTISDCACYLFCRVCVRLGMVLRRARAYKVDPSRCKALREHQCPHRVMQGTLRCLEKKTKAQGLHEQQHSSTSLQGPHWQPRCALAPCCCCWVDCVQDKY